VTGRRGSGKLLAAGRPGVPEIVEMRHIWELSASADVPVARWAGREAEERFGRPVLSMGGGSCGSRPGLYGCRGDAVTLMRSTPQPAYCEKPNRTRLTGGIVLDSPVGGSQGQASGGVGFAVGRGSAMAMGGALHRGRAGMPRTMWMPNLRPLRVDISAQRLEAGGLDGCGELGPGVPRGIAPPQPLDSGHPAQGRMGSAAGTGT